MRQYIAFIHQSEGGAYGASFPDFPGCIAVEATFEDVVASAARALRFHAEGMTEDGYAVPRARTLDELGADPEFAEDMEGATLAIIPLHPPRGRTVRLNISMDESLVSSIDEAASVRGLSRSAFLSEAAQRSLQK